MAHSFFDDRISPCRDSKPLYVKTSHCAKVSVLIARAVKVLEAASSTTEEPVATSPSASCTCQAITHLPKEGGSARTQKCNTCSLNDGGQVEAGDAQDNFEDKETKPKAPTTATAVK